MRQLKNSGIVMNNHGFTVVWELVVNHLRQNTNYLTKQVHGRWATPTITPLLFLLPSYPSSFILPSLLLRAPLRSSFQFLPYNNNRMLFDLDQNQHKYSDNSRIIYLYENGRSEQRPIQVKIFNRKNTFKDIAKLLKYNQLRLFNSDGSECFEDDLDYVKNRAVLYASKGDEFDPASCFAEYQMVKLLGQGGFGKVYLARHKQTNQLFAIKIIKTENIGSVSDIDSIFVEAEILKSLSHPNIVKVHKCLTLRNMEVVIIMEYLEGGELFKYVQMMKKLDEATAKAFLKQIVRGMLYCHQNNLTHRDLKLENLLLVSSEEKRIKIIDFGIAGAISTLKWEDLDTGSLAYMAPECFVNTKNQKFDGRLDVWSTGVIMYGMLFGELPFRGGSPIQTIECIKSGKYKLPTAIAGQLSNECLSVLKRCLDINAKTRINMQQLSDHPWFNNTVFQPSKKANEDKLNTITQLTSPQKPKQPQTIQKQKALPYTKKYVGKTSVTRIKFIDQPDKKRPR